MTTLFEKIVENTIYYIPDPPPRTRDPNKPFEVICPGFPRSATESLAEALKILGYDGVYHGWDIALEQPHRMPAWNRLVRKKRAGSPDGEHNITRADFDALIGHAVAAVDAPASVFAAEMIAAYPEAKVVLNTRRDLDAWHRSAVNNIGALYRDWPSWWRSFWTANEYWSLTTGFASVWSLLFRATDKNIANAIERNGKWIYREHNAMIRGLVPKDNLLEWTAEDGWEPLCKFLGKPIPNVPFPRVNDAAGFNKRMFELMKANNRRARRNQTIASVLLLGIVTAISWRFYPDSCLKLFRQVSEPLRAIGK